jgi:hypothetical protein
MEFSCVYFRNNRCAFYIIFVRKDNLVFINQMNNIRIVITIEMLYKDYLLYGYYLLSLCLTQNIDNPLYFEKET